MLTRGICRPYFWISVLLFALVAQSQTSPTSAIKVESAVRVRTVLDPQGNEGSCVQPADSPFSCLVIKVSGIEPNQLVDIWIEKQNGGVYVKDGDEKYDISTIKTQDNSKYTVIELTVSKAATDFALVVGNMPPVPFKVNAAIVEKLNEADLFKPTKH